MGKTRHNHGSAAGSAERLPRTVKVRRLEWIVVGMALVIIHCLLVPLSREFHYDAPLSTYPVITFVALEMLAGGIYLRLIWLIPGRRDDRMLFVFVLGVGLAVRAATMCSEPILEDDFYRYLWDGAVVAEGHDPYRYSPAEVIAAERGADNALRPLALSDRTDDSIALLRHINYPQLTTVYPPITQGAFALAATIERFSLTTWRLILLFFEAVTVVLLYLILRRLNRSPLWLAIYLWNPLVIKELVNSAHMDALLLPFLTGVVLLTLQGKRVLASFCLALAAGVKIWPVLLLPTVVRPLVARPRKLLAALAAFAAAFSGTAWWMYTQSGGDTGLTAYVAGWKMNDALFLALDWIVAHLLELLDFEWSRSGGVSRALVIVAALWVALWLNRRAAGDADALCTRFLLLAAAVFLLSPAQFPWYYTWLVPFLVLTPSPALMLLTFLLPLYYSRFYLDFRGQSQLFDYGIVWLEYLPVWLMLACEWWRATRRRPAAHLELRTL